MNLNYKSGAFTGFARTYEGIKGGPEFKAQPFKFANLSN